MQRCVIARPFRRTRVRLTRPQRRVGGLCCLNAPFNPSHHPLGQGLKAGVEIEQSRHGLYFIIVTPRYGAGGHGLSLALPATLAGAAERYQHLAELNFS